jgi:ABC-type antimicrobial peptide transport system permease subunit
MQEALRAVDPTLPFASVRRLEEAVGVTLREQRLQAALLTGFAAVALLLTAVGIFGLVADSVAQRTREVGIRMALGATVGQAMAAVAMPAVGASFAGMAVGILLCFPASRVLRNQIWGIGTFDGLTLSATVIVIAVVSVAASFVPALRLARLNPASTLREQ